MPPFCVDCTEQADSLYRLQDGRFQLIYDGPIAPLMIGFEYSLAEHKLADFLASRPLAGLRTEPATIFRPLTGEEYDTHRQLLISRQVPYDEIAQLETHGEEILIMGASHVFVSDDLKRALEAAGFSYLEFSEGLSDFLEGA